MDNYKAPICCEGTYMKLINSNHNAAGYPQYATFQCSCGNIRIMSINELDVISEENA